MRFVLLHHRDWPGHAEHYDLMLQTALGEDDDATVLETYSSLENVLPDGRVPMALRLEKPHRRKYLDYQGAVSGGRGRVLRIDAGDLLNYVKNDIGNASFEMFGRIFKGLYFINLNCDKQLILTKI